LRKKIIAGNWKMNKTPTEAKAFAESLVSGLKDAESDVVFCVPFTDICSVKSVIANTNIALGAQNMHFEAQGAYTGEISAQMLIDAGVTYVIIGHSERRQYFAETDETVNLKLKAALAANLIPIVCVGESLTQREQGITEDLVRQQIKIAFLGVPKDDALKTVVAYEPIWAIGTGKTATSEQAQEVCAAIRACLKELYGEASEKIRVQYGGSVTAANASELFSMPDIDGGLVGGASLKSDFIQIAKA